MRMLGRASAHPATDEPVIAANRRLATIGACLLVASATTLMLESTRVFVSYLIFVVDQSQRTTLAMATLGVFLSVGPVAALLRLGGTRAVTLVPIAGLAFCRLLLQLWEQPAARIALGAAGVVFWGCLMIALLVTAERRPIALGLGLGLALDLAVRIAFRTLDLPWSSSVPALLVTLSLIAVVIGSFALTRQWAQPVELEPSAALPLAAIGPGLVVYHLLSGNLGLVQIRTALSFPAAMTLLALGAILGMFAATRRTWRPRTWSSWIDNPIVADIPVGAVAFWTFWQGGWAAWYAAPFSLTITIVVLVAIASPGASRRHTGFAATAGWFTLSMLLQVALLFAYYSFSGAPWIIVLAALLFLAGSAANSLRSPTLPAARDRQALTLPAVALALVLLVAVLWQFASWSSTVRERPIGQELTAMTYNIQNGFTRDNYWSLEETARVIEEQDPDIVVIQEVSRGWLVTSMVDEVLWLSQRLQMHYAFAANSDDGLWGNVILSRAPLDEVIRHQFGQTVNLKRAVVGARLPTEGGALWVFGTHLDNPAEAGEVRLVQVTELIDTWAGRAPALLLGDFNATPESDVLARLGEAGFNDLGRGLNGPDAYTSEGRERIDYIMATDGVEPIAIEILPWNTSDHRAVVARVRLAR